MINKTKQEHLTDVDVEQEGKEPQFESDDEEEAQADYTNDAKWALDDFIKNETTHRHAQHPLNKLTYNGKDTKVCRIQHRCGQIFANLQNNRRDRYGHQKRDGCKNN